MIPELPVALVALAFVAVAYAYLVRLLLFLRAERRRDEEAFWRRA